MNQQQMGAPQKQGQQMGQEEPRLFFHDYLFPLDRQILPPEEQEKIQAMAKRMNEFCRDKQIVFITPKAPVWS